MFSVLCAGKSYCSCFSWFLQWLPIWVLALWQTVTGPYGRILRLHGLEKVNGTWGRGTQTMRWQHFAKLVLTITQIASICCLWQAALEAAHRDNEARDLLLQVRENIPENPEVNLELARISASQRNVSDALRYYHNALFGIWRGDDVDAQRQAIRRELIEFLVAQNAKEQALAETVAFAAHLPGTTAAHLQLGGLFLRCR